MCSRSPTFSRIGSLSLLASTAIAALAVPYLRPRFETLLQDPEAFTGRTQIWNAVLQYIPDHLWLGSGYGSFWSLGESSPIYKSSAGWLLDVPNAHNGYLDIVAQTGLIGLAIAIFAAFIAPMVRLAREKDLRLSDRWLLSSIIIFAILHNFIESSLFNKITPMWIFVCYAIAVISAHKREKSVSRPDENFIDARNKQAIEYP